MATLAQRHDAAAQPHLVLKPARSYWPMLAIAVAAFLLRLWFLTDRNIWYDEAISISIARLNWGGLWEVVTQKEANASVYYILLKVWMTLGESEAWVRGLSLAAGTATVAMLYAVGRRMFGDVAGALAALVLAVNAYHVRYSQETRGYALAALFAVAASWAFVRAMEDSSVGRWATYALLIIGGTYTHFFVGLVMAAHYVSVVAWPEWRRRLKPMLLVAAAVSLAVAPLFLFIAFRDAGQISWLPRPGREQIFVAFHDLSGPVGVSRLGHFARVPFNAMMRFYVLLASLTGVAAMVTWITAWRSRKSWSYALLFSWMFVPIALALLVSMKKPLFLTRYFIVCLPAWALLAGVGISKLKRPAFMAAVLVPFLALAMSGNATPRKNSWDPPYHAWKGTTGYMLSHAEPGDAIIFYHPYSVLAFEYYRRALGFPDDLGEVVYPFRQDGLLLARSEDIDYRQLWPGTEMFRRTGEHRRVWYVMPTPDNEGLRVKAVLREMFPHMEEVHEFEPIYVMRFEK